MWKGGVANPSVTEAQGVFIWSASLWCKHCRFVLYLWFALVVAISFVSFCVKGE